MDFDPLLRRLTSEAQACGLLQATKVQVCCVLNRKHHRLLMGACHFGDK